MKIAKGFAWIFAGLGTLLLLGIAWGIFIDILGITF